MSENTKKIIFVVTNTQKKSLIFVDNSLRVYSLQDAIESAQKELFENIYTVSRSGGLYLRARKNSPKNEHIDKISVSPSQLFLAINGAVGVQGVPSIQSYWNLFQQTLSEVKNDCIIIDGFPRILKESARSKIQANKGFISAAAEKFNVDIYLLSAILIDEIARLAPFENITDMLLVEFIGRDTSVVIGQVKIEVARKLIKDGYYNPDPEKFSAKNINSVSRQVLYEYVKQPEYNIFFVAALIRYFIDEWKKFIDLSKKPEIIATLYSLSTDKPKTNPQPNDRGLQITNEFYKLSKEWLK